MDPPIRDRLARGLHSLEWEAEARERPPSKSINEESSHGG